MRIQHNIMAMNAYRNYNSNTKALSGNLEKLSSGYKINRAGDDAAGLAISEKMRAQITGLDAAQKNVKDGISLVKTAEGAMQEIQDMLNRMDYLATQSANGTYQDEVDRENLQKEVTALKTEIDRIAESANFNGIKLLDGSLGSSTVSTSDVKDLTFKDLSGAAALTAVRDAANGTSAKNGIYTLDLQNSSWAPASAGAKGGITVSIGNYAITVAASTTGASITAEEVMDALKTKVAASGGKITVDGKEFKVTINGTKATFVGTDTTKFTSGVTVSIVQSGLAATAGNQAWSQAFTQVQEVTDADIPKYAQAKFTLSASDIKDGYTLKIGDETYTFAVGKDSKFKDEKGVIDLTNYETIAAGQMDEVTAKLTEAARNNKSVQVNAAMTGSGGTVYLTEKEGGIDRDVYDLMGESAGNTGDATWKGTDADGVEFSFVQSAVRTKADATQTGKEGLTLQIGDTADSYNKMDVIIGDMHTKALGIADLDIGSQDGASAAIKTIKDAINQVSSVRGDLGAIQNRLEHTGNNLSVMAENIQDAESTIRDTDVANEMMNYVKNNILVQSAQAMLAQANQVPQGVLQLLG